MDEANSILSTSLQSLPRPLPLSQSGLKKASTTISPSNRSMDITSKEEVELACLEEEGPLNTTAIARQSCQAGIKATNRMDARGKARPGHQSRFITHLEAKVV